MYRSLVKIKRRCDGVMTDHGRRASSAQQDVKTSPVRDIERHSSIRREMNGLIPENLASLTVRRAYRELRDGCNVPASDRDKPC